MYLVLEVFSSIGCSKYDGKNTGEKNMMMKYTIILYLTCDASYML